MHHPGPLVLENIICLYPYRLFQISIDQNAYPSHQSSYQAGVPVIRLAGQHDFYCQVQLHLITLAVLFVSYIIWCWLILFQAGKSYWQKFPCKAKRRIIRHKIIFWFRVNNACCICKSRYHQGTVMDVLLKPYPA